MNASVQQFNVSNSYRGSTEISFNLPIPLETEPGALAGPNLGDIPPSGKRYLGFYDANGNEQGQVIIGKTNIGLWIIQTKDSKYLMPSELIHGNMDSKEDLAALRKWVGDSFRHGAISGVYAPGGQVHRANASGVPNVRFDLFPKNNYVGFESGGNKLQYEVGRVGNKLALRNGKTDVYVLNDVQQKAVTSGNAVNMAALRNLAKQLYNAGKFDNPIPIELSTFKNVPLPGGDLGYDFRAVPKPGTGAQGQQEANKWNLKIGHDQIHALGMLLEAGVLIVAGAGLLKAWKTYESLTAAAAAVAAKTPGAKALTPEQGMQLKMATATLTSYITGGLAGTSSYALFVKEKYWDEMTSALAKGQPVEAMSEGAKAAVLFANYALAPGMISDSLATFNVNTGKKLATATLAKGEMKGFNWGMFIDPAAWTEKNITKVMGAGGEKVIEKYKPVLDELARNLEQGIPVVDKTGKLIVSADAVQKAGFQNVPEMVDHMMKTGFWRVITSKPIAGSPFVVASGNGVAGTAGSYSQLMLTRASTGVGANLALQSLSGLGIKGEVNINWDQALAAFAGGSVRSWGAPGAWVATSLGGRVASYGLSSAAAFYTQMQVKGLLAARNKTQETYTKPQLETLKKANDAYSAAMLLLGSYDKSGAQANKAIFDKNGWGIGQEYIKRLEDLMKAPDAERTSLRAMLLDRWLDEPIAKNGMTRRERLAHLTIPNDLADHFAGKQNIKLNTGTMADVGLVPRTFK
jgi:hypothetical protein